MVPRPRPRPVLVPCANEEGREAEFREACEHHRAEEERGWYCASAKAIAASGSLRFFWGGASGIVGNSRQSIRYRLAAPIGLGGRIER